MKYFKKFSVSKKAVFFLAALFFVTVFFTVGNLWIKHNHKNFRCDFKEYMTLYYPSELPIVKGFSKTENGRFLLRLSGDFDNEWLVSIDDGAPSLFKGKNPVLELKKDRHVYKIAPKNNSFSPIELKIHFVPAAVYKKAHNSSDDVIDLVASSIPVGEYERYPIKHFVKDANSYPADEVKAAKQLLENSAGIKPEDKSSVKIEKLGCFLIKNTHDKGGIPSREIASMTPFQQYMAAMKGEAKLWCHNIANI